MAIKDWPASEQPREKLLSKGAQALSDAELLAIFLRTGTKGLSAIDLARKAVQRFDGLANLLRADQQSFCNLVGLGQAKYVQLQAVMEIARRYMLQTMQRGQALESACQTRQFLALQLKDYKHEVFACLFLDSRNRVIAFEELFRGSIDSAQVYPREIIKQALHYNAASVILAHNHPSGDPQPSESDKRTTQRIKAAMDLVDIRVLDHIVIGDCQSLSFAETGLL